MTPPGAVERFRGDLDAIGEVAPSPSRRLGVAVSGGGDSLALLLLADAAFPGAVVAATVDHGLRPEARGEAETVRALCERIGIPHAILDLPPGWSARGNLQHHARRARYAALSQWAARMGVPWVAVAHHRDDVAETFLLRARRGAGVGGLAEMARVRPIGGGVVVVRPLLEWSRAELAQVVSDTGGAGAGIAPVEDPSNHHPRFDRGRMRGLLATTRELPPARLALAARNLRHAEDAIEWMMRGDLAGRLRVGADDGVMLDASGLPYELRRRFVRRAVEAVRRAHGLVDWSGSGVDRLVGLLDAGRGATLADVLARAGPKAWRFTLAPARTSREPAK